MGVILGIVAKIILALAGRWLGTEIGAQHKPLCAWLVRFAAARLPQEERAAAESEWLAIIEDLRSPTAQLVHALSLALSALRIRDAIRPERRLRYFKEVLSVNGFSMLFVLGNIVAGAYFRGDEKALSLIGALVQSPVWVKFAVAAALLTVLLASTYMIYWALHWFAARRNRMLTAAIEKAMRDSGRDKQ